jgi:hypothetical protein
MPAQGPLRTSGVALWDMRLTMVVISGEYPVFVASILIPSNMFQFTDYNQMYPA